MRVDIPEYNTFVDFPDGTSPDEITKVMAQNFPPKAPVAPPQEGFIDDVRNASRQRTENVLNPTPSAIGRVSPMAGNTVNVVAQGAGLLGDVAMSGLSRGVKAITEETGIDPELDVLKGLAGQAYEGAIKPAWNAVKGFDEGLANDFGRVGTVASVLPLPRAVKTITPAAKSIGNVAKQIQGEVGATVDDAVRFASSKIAPKAEITDAFAQKQIKSIVDKNFPKAIKTASNAKTFKMLKQESNNSVSGVVDIVKNKANLALKNEVDDIVPNIVPQTRMQALDGADQVEKILWKQADDMQKAATGQGLTLDLTAAPTAINSKGVATKGKSLIDEIDDIIYNQALNARVKDLGLIEHAKKQKALFEANPIMTPQTAQEWIINANADLLSFYGKGGNLADGNVLKFDAGMAEIMRKKLEETIAKAGHEGFSDIKKRLGSLMSLRKGLVKSAKAGQKEIVTPNFYDITSGAGLIVSIAAGNAAAIVPIISIEGASAWRRYLLNPDTYVKRMFNGVDEILTRQQTKGKFIPESKIGKKLLSPQVTPPVQQPLAEVPKPPKIVKSAPTSKEIVDVVEQPKVTKKKVKRTGKHNGKKVVELEDGTIEYAD